MEVFREARNVGTNLTEFLYEHSFPDWFIEQARSQYYDWDWTEILMKLRSGRFFNIPYAYQSSNSVTGKYLTDEQKLILGEDYIQALSALATTMTAGESVLRSLQLDGFDVDKENLTLVPLEGPVSAQQEEDRMTQLLISSGMPNSATIKRHITDAHSLYADGKYHPSLNESRSVLQGLIDDISTETDAKGKHSTKLPGGTGNRIQYLKDVGFLTADEQASIGSAWGTLSAGSHPGVPEPEEARIGLVLALEFGQVLLLKFTNWKTNDYQRFS
jgi:hypothetical protein